MGQQRIRIAVVMVSLLGGLVMAAVAAGAATTSAAVQVRCSVGGRHGLIAAINAANRAGGGTLNLARRCRYTLRTQNNKTDHGGNGLPVLTGRITINGRAGTAIVRSSARGTPDFRVIEVGEHATVSITNLTISGGRLTRDDSQGGGIDNEGTITSLTNDTIRGNRAGFGGGVFNNGRIINLSNDNLAGNSAGNGGALANLNRITRFTGDRVVANKAGIGGGITNGGAIATLSNSVISDNRLTANGAGGGISNLGLLNMSNDLIARNTATAGPQASGGGIDDLGRLTLTDSVVRDNVARGVGGGLRNEEPQDPHSFLVIRRSKVIHNTVVSSRGPATGGGIYNGGVMSVIGSTVRDNRATASVGRAVGAGVYSADSLSVSQTLISANVVSDRGGEAEGGGLYVDEGSKRSILTGSRVIGNLAIGAHPHGGGIFFAGGAAVRLTATVVHGNRPENCYPRGSVAGCRGV